MLKFKIKNTLIEIRASFFMIIAFMLLIGDGMTVTISLVSSLLHECGHVVASVIVKEKIDRLLFCASGLRIDRRHDLFLSFGSEIFIALSGAGVNLLIAFSAGIFYFLYSLGDFAFSICAVNVVIALFNLLPVESLDGARGLMFFLCRRIPEEKAQRIVTDISVLTVFLLIMFFSVTVYIKIVNPSLAVVIIYLIILLINRILQLKKSKL